MASFKFVKGVQKWYGEDEVANWQFESEEEAELATCLWLEAKKNGISINHFQHLFPCVLRMIGSNSVWSKI